MPRTAAYVEPVSVVDAWPSGCSLRVEPDQGLAGRDQVAVLDQPLHDLAAVRRPHLGPVARAGDVAERRRRARARRRSAASLGAVEGALGRARRPSARSGVVSITEASPCLAQKARASSSWSGVLRAKVSTPGQGALGDAGERAGGRHLEHAGDAEVGHGLHAEVPADRAGDLADDARHDLAAVVDDLAVAVGDPRRARVVGRDRAGQRRPGGRRRAPCARCGTRRPR